MSLTEFDSSKYRLGTLCWRGHDWNQTGQSLRYKNAGCFECHKMNTQKSQAKKKLLKNHRTQYQKLLETLGQTLFTEECYEWQNNRTASGYGMVSINYERFYIHRVALEHKLGRPIREGLSACHTCDNPSCFNPNHLYEGTQQQNSIDRESKNRGNHVAGEYVGSSKLTADQVIEIRNRHARGETQKDLAAEFGMSRSGIWHVIHRNWKHI